jgi:hypothetical protein
MKPLPLLILLALLMGNAVAQVPTSVAVVVVDQLLQNDDEWVSYLRADLYDLHNTLVEPSSSYFYVWELKVEDGSWYTVQSGWGLYNPNFDGHWYERTLARVIVDIGESNLYSPSLSVALQCEPRWLTYHPKKQDGTDLTTDDLVLQHWTGSQWTLHQISASPESSPTSGAFLGDHDGRGRHLARRHRREERHRAARLRQAQAG